ncbi:hypothetical protein RRG08_066981 [Elysia crispata]|uniref:Uncharacterized protein n=1 Tax=Elysia crispata TaxID=231223 RepID=A0AAE1DCA1_9GAST|nr:hypothetical protein RRG08_066981 [Elysia crispata]
MSSIDKRRHFLRFFTENPKLKIGSKGLRKLVHMMNAASISGISDSEKFKLSCSTSLELYSPLSLVKHRPVITEILKSISRFCPRVLLCTACALRRFDKRVASTSRRSVMLE